MYGTEETVRYDAPQWDMATFHTVAVAAPATFTGTAGTHHLWDDFTVRYDQDGVILAADSATAAAIAAERVTQYFAAVYGQTLGYLTQTYAGALPFATGSRVGGVKWVMGGSDQAGWRTQIVRGAEPPWPNLWD